MESFAAARSCTLPAAAWQDKARSSTISRAQTLAVATGHPHRFSGNTGLPSGDRHGQKSKLISWRNTPLFGEPSLLDRCSRLRRSAGNQSRATAEPKAFTEQQEGLVKEAWKVLKKDAARHGLSMFLKVFEIAPSTKRLFPFLQDTTVPLNENPHLKAHALLVFKMTCEAAISLRSEGVVSTPGSTLKNMGLTHWKSGIVNEHFDVVKYCLLKTLEEGLPADMWSAEMKEAWGEAYEQLASAIKAAMQTEAQAAADVEPQYSAASVISNP